MQLTNEEKDRMTSQAPQYPMPFTRLELCVFGLLDRQLAVLQVRRAEAPAAGKWALPGGVLRIDLDSDLERGAQRIAHERLGTGLSQLKLQAAVGGRSRDPRSPWALSLVYRAAVRAGELSTTPGKRVEALRWAPAEEAAADDALAFDHARIIGSALEGLRSEVDTLQLPWGLLPPEFTLGELQQFCEAILGRSLDKSSFRRRLDDKGCVEPIVGALRGAAHRPAQVYRVRSAAAATE